MSRHSRLLGFLSRVGLGATLIGGSSFAGADATVSFALDVQPVFEARCVRCHNATTTRGGLDLSADVSYNNLVNVPTSAGCMMEVPDSQRVVPFCTTTSMLWLKCAPDPGRCRAPMPLMTEGLGIIAPEEFALVETWILEGALNN